MVCRCTGLLTAALLVFTAVEAGVLPRYRNGYTPPVRGCLQQLPAQSWWSVADPNDRCGRATVQARKEEDLSSSNHQPAKLLRAHRLPRKFDWCDPLDKVRKPVTRADMRHLHTGYQLAQALTVSRLDPRTDYFST